METVQEDKITFEQIKEVYKEMMKERAKEKFRNWDREYKKCVIILTLNFVQKG